MRVFSHFGVIWALYLYSHIETSNAKPISPAVIELRIRNDIGSIRITSGNDSPPIISVREVPLVSRNMVFPPEYQPNGTTMIILENLLAMHRQKRTTSEYKRYEAIVEERQTYGGRVSKCDKKKKHKLCDGIYKMFWNAATKKCDLCEAGKEPTAKGDKCVTPETPEEKKQRGRCPKGMRLDLSVPSQNENTLNPVCIDREGNQQNRCPSGQSETTQSSKTKSVKCAPDDEPDKKCKAKDTVVFKEVGPDGKMKNTCRSTRDKEDKKKSNAKQKLGKIRSWVSDEYQKRVRRENNSRSRRAACLALGAVTFLAPADIEALGDLEVEGLIEPDENSHVPDIDMMDWMISVNKPLIGTVEMDTAGGGNWIAAFGKVIVRAFQKGGGQSATRPKVPKSRPATLFGGGDLARGGARFKELRNKYQKSGRQLAKPAAKAAAAKSTAVKNVLKSKTFQDCLAVGAGAALGAVNTKVQKRQENSNKYNYSDEAGRLAIDLDAGRKENFPAPDNNAEVMMLYADSTTDAGGDEDPDIQFSTYQDGYNRADRLYYQGCGSFVGTDNDNKITLLQTWNGCCKYYNGEQCESDTALFAQTDRQDGQLKGSDNDAVSSFWCTFDPGCAEAP